MAFDNISALLTRRVTLKASAALPAAGAFDTPTAVPCNEAEFVSLYFTYTLGAAGGSFTFRIETSPDSTGTDFYRASLEDPPAVAAGADTLSLIQCKDVDYEEVTGAVEKFVYGPISLGMAAQRIQVSVAETGVVGTQGTVQIEALFG